MTTANRYSLEPVPQHLACIASRRHGSTPLSHRITAPRKLHEACEFELRCQPTPKRLHEQDRLFAPATAVDLLGVGSGYATNLGLHNCRGCVNREIVQISRLCWSRSIGRERRKRNEVADKNCAKFDLIGISSHIFLDGMFLIAQNHKFPPFIQKQNI